MTKPVFKLKPLVVAMRRVRREERFLRQLEAQQRAMKEATVQRDEAQNRSNP